MEEQETGEEFPVAADGEGVTETALREAAVRLGYAGTPEPVAALANVLRRGNDVVALAGEGSGKELLYALAAAERVDPGSPAVQALVLCPTPEAASRAGRALHLLGADRGLASLTWLPWRQAREGEEPPFAQLLAGRPGELLPQVQAGRLKLGDLSVLAVDGVSALEATGGWSAVEALLDTLPSEVQKVLTDVRRSERLEGLIKHRVSRAKKWPAELFAPGADRGEDAGSRRLLWAAGAGEEERLDRLADTLQRAAEASEDEGAVVRCRDGATAHRVAASLAARGFELTDRLDEPGVVVAWGEDEPPPEGVGVLYGLPLSLEDLGRWLGGAAVRGVIVRPAEADQLRLLARRAGWRLEAVPDRPPAEAADAVEAFRERIRRRLESHDDAAESLVLEPLLEAHGVGRVAGALSALLRQREPPAEARPRGGTSPPADRVRTERTKAPEQAGDRRPARGAAARDRRAAAREDRSGWTRLFISAGKRDDVGPGDLVGAITGETPAEGGQIGRIEIRESYSLVDVDRGVADRVMEELTGVRIKGREVIARRDRKE